MNPEQEAQQAHKIKNTRKLLQIARYNNIEAVSVEVADELLEIVDSKAQKIAEQAKQIERLKTRPNLHGFIEVQRAFSLKTFGPENDKKRIISHIQKELAELDESGELIEWIDIILLALDGAWRGGASPQEISEAMDNKLRININREWPNWRTTKPGEPIEHIEQSLIPPQDSP